MRSLFVGAIVMLLAAAGVADPGAAAEWHHPLYLPGGGYWRSRIRIEVTNAMNRDAQGLPVTVGVGKGDGRADLAGAAAEAVRVCDATGAEMLYDIRSPAGSAVTRGPIPPGGTLTIPVECAAEAKAAYYVYFENPSAWRVPDVLDAGPGLRNGGLEDGAGNTPTLWRHDAQDPQHRTFWVSEHPHSGKRCLKTVVADGAEPTWIATRCSGIHITGGARYVMRAWVRAEAVKGNAGWYIHVRKGRGPFVASPMLMAGGGTYDWKEVRAEFTAPADADRADVGTVLRGTGTAWFDDVQLECLDPPRLSAKASAAERLSLREVGPGAAWRDGEVRRDHRVPVRVMSFSDRPGKTALVCTDLAPLASRLRGRLDAMSIAVSGGAKPVPHYVVDDMLLFEGETPARARCTYHVYVAQGKPAPGDGGAYARLVESPRNLVRNAGFESGDALPDDWPGGVEGKAPNGATTRLVEGGRLGKRCVRVRVPHGAQPAWTGWHQNVAVEPGKTYLFAGWVKCEDVRGTVQLHAHYRNATGDLCESAQYASAGRHLSGTHGWTLMSGRFTMPPDIAAFQLHLTMNATGTVWHDGVVLVEVMRASAGPPEARPAATLPALTVWPVNPVVKVFQSDGAPREIPALRISAARNEKEPLQLAVRSPVPVKGVRIEVDPPSRAGGGRLGDVETCLVGYVPIDHRTNYYRSESPAWHRKVPSHPGGSDGWPGMWPDPLLPRHTFDLAPHTTQPVWVTVSVPKSAAAGDYTGAVRLVAGGKTVATVPLTVRVWDFALPEESHVKAVYDVRLHGSWWRDGVADLGVFRRRFWSFMAERRLCPDQVEPPPRMTYRDGKVTADFTAYDEAAEYYFNVLKLPHTYAPRLFYVFGWAHPPKKVCGEAPYPGEYPYADADRAVLRPEYKRAYQACLKVYWDHMKAKGWADRVVLYISDEPHDRHEHIRRQMKALCEMIHEVDSRIPIYSSTWRHQSEWDGAIDIWGIGHYGVVPVPKMAGLLAAGDRLWFTTDGHMCTDTPYCGIERLLPHYCFKYGVEAYEFWGIDWLTYNPWEFGWHAFIHQSDSPGSSYHVRYPNGDGYLAYPGGPVGHDGPVSSIRLEQAREGVEDYEYLYLLRSLVEKAKAAGGDAGEGEAALERAGALVAIPNAGGRYSTRFLPDPDAVPRLKDALGRAIEGLSQ